MKKTLILFAKGFPYNISEPFLENEYPLYSQYFDNVLIVSGCKRGEQPTRVLHDPTIEVISDYTLGKDVRSIIAAIPLMITDPMFYCEVWNLLKTKRFSTKNMYRLIVAALCGNHRALLAKRWIRQSGVEDRISAIYSYWLDIPAYAALRLRDMLKNPGLKVVSRCHGYDLYSERADGNYIPFQSQIIRRLDRVASVSVAGMKYLQDKYPLCDNICTRYLGGNDMGSMNPISSRDTLHVVSCARIVPLKRLNRIVDGLSLIHDRKVVWTHIGGGEGLEELKEYAAERLPENISVEWCGTISNMEVYEMYKSKPFHALVSVSSTEGLPVSMCEAFSFHIPVISTNVGGVAEIVHHEVNGWLIPPDFLDTEFAAAIETLATMPEDKYQMMRNAARNQFSESFDAINNHKAFIVDFLI